MRRERQSKGLRFGPRFESFSDNKKSLFTVGKGEVLEGISVNCDVLR